MGDSAIPLPTVIVHADTTPVSAAIAKAAAAVLLAYSEAAGARHRGPGRQTLHLQVALSDHFAQALAAHPDSYLTITRLAPPDAS